jgi:hypothetical protein
MCTYFFWPCFILIVFIFFLLPEGTVLRPGVGLLGQPAPERTVFVSGPALGEDDNQLAAGDAEKCKVCV